VQTVYLGTSDFAAAVLDRLAASAHRPSLVVTRPDRPKGRGRRTGSTPVAERARELGIELTQPEDLHAPDVLARIRAAAPAALVVCAYGALVKEPLLSEYEILNVHPSLLPRWRGAAPIERAMMAGDQETGVSIMRLTAGLDSGPVCLQERTPIEAGDDYGTVSKRLEALGSDLLIRALDERPPFTEQPEEGVRYAHKIVARDRQLDPTRRPERVERVVRALRPHIGARLALPDGTFLGVWAAALGGETLAPAGGRVRSESERLYLDCAGGALELLEIQPPGGRRMAASEWLRGRPDPGVTDFWMDPQLPHLAVAELVRLAGQDWGEDTEWAPFLSALCWRGDQEVLDAMRDLTRSGDARERSVAAYVLGQCGLPTRTFPGECAAVLEELALTERDPEVLAVLAHALGNLGPGHGTGALVALRDHEDREVRDGVAHALAGRDEDEAVAALVGLSRDEDHEIRDWATFALGALCPRDTPEIREALAARLGDHHEDVRVEAVHGLSLRGDDRALEAAIELLARTERDGGLWAGHALEETAIRLAGLTGDERLAPYLPAMDERWRGNVLEHELERALERTAAPRRA